MTVRHYSSLDAGAPALINTGGTVFANLRLVLKACLVDGYGSQPAAGWALGHDVTDGFSLVSGGGVLVISNPYTSSVEFTIMETITDGSTAIPSGYNRRSGQWFDGETTTARHRLYCSGFTAYTNKRWSVVADDRTVIVFIAGSSAGVDTSNSDSGVFYFGEYQAAYGQPGFCCLGGYYSSGFTGSNGLFKEAGGAILRNPFDGLVDQGTAPKAWASCPVHGAATSAYNRSKVMPADLRPTRAALVAYGAGLSGSTSSLTYVVGGRLRGLVSEPTLSSAYLSQALELLEVNAPAAEDAVKPITLVNGSIWVPMFPSTNDLGGFASLDASEWD